jgi:hypothetical protein
MRTNFSVGRFDSHAYVWSIVPPFFPVNDRYLGRTGMHPSEAAGVEEIEASRGSRSNPLCGRFRTENEPPDPAYTSGEKFEVRKRQKPANWIGHTGFTTAYAAGLQHVPRGLFYSSSFLQVRDVRN